MEGIDPPTGYFISAIVSKVTNPAAQATPATILTPLKYQYGPPTVSMAAIYNLPLRSRK